MGTSQTDSQYVISQQPHTLPQRSAKATEKDPSKLGIDTTAFSCDGRYLATHSEALPHAVWIWNITRMCLEVVMVQLKPVKALHWDPVHCRLGICTGSKRFYMWCETGSTCVSTAAVGLAVQRFRWNPDGCSVVLQDTAAFCLAYPTWNEG
eukprot:NODE_4753_length_555_cov_141.944664_g3469_i0.p2 GENE.NODE_4753_length_555_cov_141.944664_g3469_i0~~NODE_4753_length_555_cov_141.944664_g3469_i0.p2  ORF type:complete len:158 (+),score=67.89 NODE_4753_length_555_cov_141.944664_g3469_i0:24-476(+)